MSLQNFLLEGKKENLIDKYKDNVIFVDSPNLLEKIIDEDPSATKKYSEWTIKQVIDFMNINNGASLPDVISQITDLVKEFHDLTITITDEDIDYAKNLHSGINDTYIKGAPKDINRYKVYWELQTVLSAIKKRKEEKEEEEKAKKDIEKIYEDNRFLIVRPFTHQASCYYGSNTKWCTTSKNDESYFNRYTGSGDLIYIIDKEATGHSSLGKMAINIDKSGNVSVWDQQDQQRSVDFMLERFEPIKNIINEILKGDDDYVILKKSLEGKSGKKSLSADYFDRIEGDYVYLSFDTLDDYLSLFKEDYEDYELRNFSNAIEPSYGFDEFYYDSYSFDDDMKEGYVMYAFKPNHLKILKDILKITGSDLVDCFKATKPNVSRESLKKFIEKGNDEKDFYDLYKLEISGENCQEKIGKYLIGLDEDFMDTLNSTYSYAQDKSMQVGVQKYLTDEFCSAYENIGLVPEHEGECFRNYKIPIQKLIDIYESDLESNSKLTLDKVLNDYVSRTLRVPADEPHNLAYEHQDLEEFNYHFDDDIESALERLKEKLEDSEDYEDLSEYRRLYSYISNKYGFMEYIPIETSNDNLKIRLQRINPEDNKIEFELLGKGGFKKGRAKLSTIESLMNNYQLFDPLED